MVGVLVVLGVLVLYFATDFIGTLERRYYDFSSTAASRQASDKIAIIAIDDQSIANIGRWPWSREVHARLIDQLSAAGAKTIAHTAFFFEPQTDRGSVYIQKIKDALGAAPGADALEPDPNEPLRKIVEQAQTELNTDAQLAASMARAGNVILPSFFTLGEPQGKAARCPALHSRARSTRAAAFLSPAVAASSPSTSLALRRQVWGI
jgi:eukaryotic-like serine/threonine-protein kinase